MYIDLDYYHPNAVEEAFYSTDSVLTISFHHLSNKGKDSIIDNTANNSYNNTNDIKNSDNSTTISAAKDQIFHLNSYSRINDIGVDKGEGYSINFPFKSGVDDTTYVNVFRTIITKAYECYKPEVVVLQCGTSSLAGDRFGDFNLTLNGHCDCVKFVKSLNVSMLVLGGSGINIGYTAKVWARETAILFDLDEKEIDNYFYGSDTDEKNKYLKEKILSYTDSISKFNVLQTTIKNENEPEYIKKQIDQILTSLEKLNVT